MPRHRMIALGIALSVLAATAARAQPGGPPPFPPAPQADQTAPPGPPPPPADPNGPPGLPPPAEAQANTPPAGPALNCADFVHNSDETWSAAHPVPINNGAETMTLYPAARFRKGAIFAGLDLAPLLDQQCGGR